MRAASRFIWEGQPLVGTYFAFGTSNAITVNVIDIYHPFSHPRNVETLIWPCLEGTRPPWSRYGL
jgi:hypothetical protein